MRNLSYENDLDLQQNETACRTHFHVKGFVLNLDSFWNRGKRELGNGLLGQEDDLNNYSNKANQHFKFNIYRTTDLINPRFREAHLLVSRELKNSKLERSVDRFRDCLCYMFLSWNAICYFLLFQTPKGLKVVF